MMDDFWNDRNGPRRMDPFFDDSFGYPFNQQAFSSPFSVLHQSMQQMHREMNEMMRHVFSGFDSGAAFPPSLPSSTAPRPAIDGPTVKDLDKQVQQYGVNSIFDERDYMSDWDFVKRLEQLEKDAKPLLPVDGEENNNGVKFYGRSHFYNYRSNGDGKVEERKVIQDTRGNRMESVQRKLGDRLWAKTTKQNQKGEVDENEKLYNMDEQDKDKFMNEWRAMKTNGLPYANDNSTVVKSIDTSQAPSAVPVETNSGPTQFTLQSLEEKSGGSWLDKLKFWSKK